MTGEWGMGLSGQRARLAVCIHLERAMYRMVSVIQHSWALGVHGQGAVMKGTLFGPGGMSNGTGRLRGRCWSLLDASACRGLKWCFSAGAAQFPIQVLAISLFGGRGGGVSRGSGPQRQPELVGSSMQPPVLRKSESAASPL